jgi:decaprenyl-phosphate phosphoribosyltransferase
MLLPYIRIARLDHWFKHVFLLPGVVLAIYWHPGLLAPGMVVDLAITLLVAGLISSSYYVLNEILDAPSDALHPVKRDRPIPSGAVNLSVAWAQFAALAVVGLGLAWWFDPKLFAVAAVLWCMGLAYNVPPVRCKDKPYLDVIVESINNPLRLLLGWYGVGMDVFPPISLIAAYWMLGAFFMGVKRFSEYRHINDPEVAGRYRRSFVHYNEERLLVSVVFYAVAFGLFFGIFLVRYRIEWLLAVPFIAGFIGWYIHLGFLKDSPAQYPERLYRQRGFVVFTAVCVAVMLFLLFFDIPGLVDLFVPTMPTQSAL